MYLKKPIFVIGTGRCGSTIFHKIFSHHSKVSWFSGLTNKFPNYPKINRYLMNSLDIPFIGKLLSKRFKPWENYHFWEYYLPGFSEPSRDLTRKDITVEQRNKIKMVIENTVSKSRPRLLVKLTGWPRIEYIKEIFPDAQFIHVVRDGRAVVNSLLNVDFWRGRKGPDKWRWGPLSSKHEDEWNKKGKSLHALAAIQYKIIMSSFENAKKQISSKDFLEFRYEDFVKKPEIIFEEVLNFTQLEFNKNFKNKIKEYNLKNMNFKWKDNFTDYEQEDLNQSLKQYLELYGYNE